MRREIVAVCAMALTLVVSVVAQDKRTGADSAAQSGNVARLIDPGFESFRLADGPIFGWYSADVMYTNDPRYAGVTMTPDSKIKVEGLYSLRIEQIRPRYRDQGQAYLSQAVRLPKRGGIRLFDLGLQMRGGVQGPVTIDIYVWNQDNVARVIAQRDVNVTMEWTNTTVPIKVPEGHDQFGIWLYLPRDNEAQLWVDDVQLTPKAN